MSHVRMRQGWFKGHRAAVGFAAAIAAGAAAIVPLFQDSFPRDQFAYLTFGLVVLAGVLQALELSDGPE